jgi:heat shock protein HslJ
MRRLGLEAVVRAGLALLLLGALAACADDPDDASSDTPATTSGSPASESPAPVGLDATALEGTSYASTSVEGRELVAGTSVEVGFEGGTMSVWAGCNTVFGPFEVDGTTLTWSAEPATTLMACDPDREAQDEWLTDLFRGGVDATVDGDTLTVAADDTTIELATAAPEDLSALLGRTWTVIGTVSDGAVSRLPVNTRRPRLDVGSDGLARLFTGCRSGRVTVQVDGDALVFSNATVQRGRCTGPARKTERAVLALLDGPSDNAELHDHLLVVTKAGEGLFFEVR